MRRRDLLAVTSGALCGLAGCASTRFERLQTRRPDTDGGPASDSSGGSDRDAGESAAPIVVGNAADVPFPAAHPPHRLTIRNETQTERTVSVAIGAAGDDGTDGGDALLERSFDLSPSDAIEIALVEPRSYRVTVTTGGSDSTGDSSGSSKSTVSVGVDRHPFDCTRSRTTVTLSGAGVQTESTASSISCPVPAVAETSLEVGSRRCAGQGDDDAATVEFADETVLVDGTITLPTPCHTVSIAETAYDERRDALAITLAVGEQEAGHCIDCIASADYTARIDLEGRYPGRVVVRHETRGEGKRVATAESPAA